jgi:hypothetical protein
MASAERISWMPFGSVDVPVVMVLSRRFFVYCFEL